MSPARTEDEEARTATTTAPASKVGRMLGESTGSTRHQPVPSPTATRTAAAAESTSSAVVAGPRTLLHGDRGR
jgi:hypothetical protein